MSVFDQLLRDGGGAFHHAARGHVAHERAQHRFDVIAFMGVKSPVFQRDESALDHLGYVARGDVVVCGVLHLVAVPVQNGGHSRGGGEERRVEFRVLSPLREPDVTSEGSKPREQEQNGEGHRRSFQYLFPEAFPRFLFGFSPTAARRGGRRALTHSFFHRDYYCFFALFYV